MAEQKTETWYEGRCFAVAKIQPIEVVSHTEHSVRLPNGRRQMRETEFYTIQPTHEAVRLWMIDRVKQEIEDSQAKTDRLFEKLLAVQALKEPKIVKPRSKKAPTA